MQVHTVCVGAAIGHACLLLSAGTKGKRFMMPHSKGKKKKVHSGQIDCSFLIMRDSQMFEPILLQQ